MSHRSNYRKLQQSESNAEEHEEELKKRTRAERLDLITAKIHAVFWVAAAICIFIFTDIFNVALYNEKVNRYCYCYCYYSNLFCLSLFCSIDSHYNHLFIISFIIIMIIIITIIID